MPLRRLTRFSRIELEKEQAELRAHDRGARRDHRRRAAALEGRLRRAGRGRQDLRHPATYRPARVRRYDGDARRRARRCEVADDPCFAFLSSSALLARSSRRDAGTGRGAPTTTSSSPPCARPPAATSASSPAAAAWSARRARPAGAPGVAPTTPTCRAGCPVSEVLSARGRRARCSRSPPWHRRPGSRARHPPGRRQAGQPRGAHQPRRVGGDRAQGRRRGGRRHRSRDRHRDAVLRHLRRPAAPLRRPTACGRRAAPAAAWPASASRPASAWSGSARSAPRPATASWSPRPARPPPCPAPSPAPAQGDAVRRLPRQGPRHRWRALPPLPQGRGHPGARLGRTPPGRAAAASGAPVDLPEANGRRDGSGTPGRQPIAACAGPVAASAAVLSRCARLTRVLAPTSAGPSAASALGAHPGGAAAATTPARRRRRDARGRRWLRPQPTLTETSGVQLTSTTDDLPEGINAHPEGRGRRHRRAGLRGQPDRHPRAGRPSRCPSIAVDDDGLRRDPVHARAGPTSTRQSTAPPTRPASSPPTTGSPPILGAATGLEKGESVRGGADNDEILTDLLRLGPRRRRRPRHPRRVGRLRPGRPDHRRRRAARAVADRRLLPRRRGQHLHRRLRRLRHHQRTSSAP